MRVSRMSLIGNERVKLPASCPEHFGDRDGDGRCSRNTASAIYGLGHSSLNPRVMLLAA